MKMRQEIIWFLVCIICAGLIAGCTNGPEEEQKDDAAPGIYDVYKELSQGDIVGLEQIIESSADSDVRESAVIVVTDLAISTNATDDVVPFLKNVALHEEDDTVRSAAYANLALIRESYPEEAKGTLDLRIDGPIGAGQNITLVATVSSSVKTEKALVGIKKILGGDGKPTTDILLVDAPRLPIKLQLAAGSPKEIPILLHIGKQGKYSIFYVFQLDLDRVDSQVIEKEVYIYFENGIGKYLVADV